MHTPQKYAAAFDAARPYDEYVAGGAAHEQQNWKTFAARLALKPEQAALIESFARRINVLVISGLWCGDCVQQCPILAQFEKANPAPRADRDAGGIDLRFMDRDADPVFAAPFKVCGGQRVPVAIFLNEDFEFIALAGDKLLARFRLLAARALGASCPLPGAAVPSDEVAAVTQDWLNEFERVALLLRLSSKLRQKHND
ncbi:hypothetical protein BH11PLA1_BH11PLA1_03380 [soil metagenome]